MNRGYLSFDHACTNHSDLYILVGNARDFISSHKTMSEAENALSKISVGESVWAKIEILAPNESNTMIDLQKTIYSEIDDNEDRFNLFKNKQY